MKRKVYIDSCVLIHALKVDKDELAKKAIAEISDENVEYLFSPMTELEVLPNPSRNHFEGQVEFFNEWFSNSTRVWYTEEIHEIAIDQATKYAIKPLDVTHVATAIKAGADELVTAEGPTKPMCKSREIHVRSILRGEDERG